jgi:UDPglucose--hexose-1-phosphate uridylyltransferase
MPELRKDPVVERWVIIATERARRPMDFPPTPALPHRTDECPFCPGHEDRTPPELYRSGGPENGSWAVRVVPNKFPALHPDSEVHAAGEGIYDRMDGVGAHEVVIETPDHFGSLGTLPVSQVGEVLVAYRERLHALRKDARLEYVLIFKNHGVAAGASLVHPHSQLIATPILPELVAEEIAGAARYFRMKERCVWCDVVSQERRDGARLVLEEDGFVALAPFAPRFPFETWILPTAHRATFESVGPDEVDALARLLRGLIARLGRLFDDPPYNFALHTAPLKAADSEHFHWHLELMPKLTHLAGFELGTGFFINPTPPEDAARFLRQAEPESGVPTHAGAPAR